MTAAKRLRGRWATNPMTDCQTSNTADKVRRPRRTLWGVALLLLLLASLVGVSVPSYMNTMTPAGIVIHHAALTSLGDGTPLDIAALDRVHERRGFGAFYWGRNYHVGYHYLILPDGTIQQGRPEHCMGAHTQGYNTYIGVCLVGNFSSADNPNGEKGLMQPTQAQMSALVRLCRDLQGRYKIPTQRVLFHRGVEPATECPGDRFPAETFLSGLGATDGRSSE